MMLSGLLKKYNILICLVGLLFIATAATAAEKKVLENPFAALAGGDTLRLDLQSAILMSLERNPAIQLQLLQPLVAKTYARQAASVYDPTLAVSAARVKSKTQRFLGAQRTPFELTSERTDYAASLSQNLPTGTNLTGSFLETSNISSIYTDQYTGNMQFTITQSLLQGLGFGANLASLRQARLDVQISQSEFKAVAEQAVASLENAYWTLVLARQEADIQQQSLELAQKQLSESVERVAVGKLPVLELAAVHAEVSARKEALIDAQSRFEQARLGFIYLVTPAAADAWTIMPIPTDRPFIPADTLDAVSLHVQAGMQYRPDLLQAQYSLKKGDVELSRTRNGLLPKLDFFISFGRSAYAQSFKSSLPDKHSPYYETNMGLSFEFPVLKLNDRAQWQRAHYTQEQMQLALENMKLMVEWDIRAAYVEVIRSRQQISATIITRELQEKKLDAELEKFRVGKSTNYLVLQAQRELTSSQLDQARAQVAYLNALVSLYQMEGTLLNRRNIAY